MKATTKEPLKTKLADVCVTVQFPAELDGFLKSYAKNRYTTSSAILRGLVLDLKTRTESVRTVMEESDTLPSSRTLSRIAKTARKGGVL